jgi:hypothetical protein
VIADLAVELSQIYIGTITLTQPTLNKNHQRITTTGGAFSKGEGPVPLVISCTEPPSRLDFRVRNAASPASVLQDWTTLDFQRITGTQTVSPMIPAGFYSYLIDIRPNQDAAKIVSTTNAVTVGHIVAIAGQSLALDLFSPVASGDTTTIATLGLTISTWGRVYASYGVNSGAFPAIPDSLLVNSPPASWELPNDAGNFDSTGVVVIISRLEGVLGVPVSPVGFAVGGTGIDTWLPDYAGTGTDHHVRLLSILDAAGFNGFSSMVWFQGHYESRNGNTAPLYLAQLQEFFTVLRARYGQFQAAMCSIGAIGSYVGSVANINMVRATMLAYVASDPLSAYFDALDPEPRSRPRARQPGRQCAHRDPHLPRHLQATRHPLGRRARPGPERHRNPPLQLRDDHPARHADGRRHGLGRDRRLYRPVRCLQRRRAHHPGHYLRHQRQQSGAARHRAGLRADRAGIAQGLVSPLAGYLGHHREQPARQHHRRRRHHHRPTAGHLRPGHRVRGAGGGAHHRQHRRRQRGCIAEPVRDLCQRPARIAGILGRPRRHMDHRAHPDDRQR